MSAIEEKPNEQVIYEKDDVRVFTVTKAIIPGTDHEVEFEPGERVIIQMPLIDGHMTHRFDFQRYFEGQTICPYGMTDAALAAILKFRFEQKRNREDTPMLDAGVYGEWIQTLQAIIDD